MEKLWRIILSWLGRVKKEMTDNTEPAIYIAMPLIKKYEGFHAEPYICPAGVLTIGWGRTHDIEHGDKTTEVAEDFWLIDYLIDEDKQINKLVKVPLSKNQRAALLSFVYNLGIKQFADSTLLKMLNEGKYFEAACQFERWKHSNGKVLRGLVRRRADEANLFCSP